MKHRVRQNFSLALVALLSLAAGCSERAGETADHAEPLVLGFSQVVAEANWHAANTESIRKAANEAGIGLQLENAFRRQENQVAALRSFVNQRVDVIAFTPVVENGWEAVLREIRSAGIPVILMDRAVEVSDESLYASLIGSDFVEEGRRAGRWLLEHTAESSGEIGIVELQGTVGSAPANDRKQGFAEVIAADSRYRIIRSQSGDFDRTRARELMTEFLQTEGRRIRVVFAHSDTMAFGAIEAIEAAGKVPGKDIKIVTIDAVKDGMQALADGKINFIVECSPLLGNQLVEIVEKVVAGEDVEKRIITEETTFTQEQAIEALPDRKY